MTRTAMSLAFLLATTWNLNAIGAAEIGFVEDFAVGDRQAALEQLIPGSDDYFYYHCLSYQHSGQLGEVDQALDRWVKQHRSSPRLNEIRNRQALLKYDTDPQESLEFIRRRLGVRFDHRRQHLDQKADVPTALDPKIISRDTLTQRALSRHKNLGGFEDRSLDWLSKTNLNPTRRRHLLQRLRRPDVVNLPKLVVDDLHLKGSRGFGSLPIHGLMLRDQLVTCIHQDKQLLNNSNFVKVYLSKLRPGPDEPWQHDPVVRQAYLERLWEFAKRLPDAHNSIKANVLYHRLAFDRAQGTYDGARFMTYIKLPRQVGYINPKYIRQKQNRHRANLASNYQTETLLPPVGGDEPLVRSYLHHFFIRAEGYKKYEPYIRDTYLRQVFAETKIVNGIGDMEKWYAMLSPAQYKALKDRVDLDFAPTNKIVFAAKEPVALDLFMKNVEKLIVKVYRINALNYYRAQNRQVGTDIHLDGLVANQELTFQYTEPSLRRVHRHFTFDRLDDRGIYVVDFIGNGKSSRALIQKGRLQFLVKTTSAGHQFAIMDEENRKVSNASIHVAGHHYQADGDGTILVPFTNEPGRQSVILVRGDFASLDSFEHESENYALEAGFQVDREALLNGKPARLAVRPMLKVNGRPAPLGLLEKVRLTITSVDLDGVAATKQISDFLLQENTETIQSFQVPPRLHTIRFVLEAQIKNLSQAKTADLSDHRQFVINEIDKTEKTEALHMLQDQDHYVLALLGKTGEPKPDRPVALSIKHRDFKETIQVTLKSDTRGRIHLGRLEQIASVQATGPQGTSRTFALTADAYDYPSNWHGAAGQPLKLPYLGRAKEAESGELSLLERRGDTFVSNQFNSLSIQDGFIVIDDLPAGDYDLLLKDPGHRITIRLTDGVVDEGFVLSKQRQLQVNESQPVHIVRVGEQPDSIKIQLAHATDLTRVHVIATHYVPVFSPYDSLRLTRSGLSFVNVPPTESIYLVGRDIGDEYRYILDRKYAGKHPGNMLERPMMLLNPWAIRKTQTGQQRARPESQFERAKMREKLQASAAVEEAAPVIAGGDHVNLDFLAQLSINLYNLAPDSAGAITIDRETLGDRHHLHIVAVDPTGTVYRQLALSEPQAGRLDLRLAHGLNPSGHFTEQKSIGVFEPDQNFVIEDITTAQFETYDSLAKVYRLFDTLKTGEHLDKFRFILEWPNLAEGEKQQKYSKFACHELNFFFYKKDRAFFDRVIKPYIANKKDKTFLDRWLLGDDLSDYQTPWSYARLNIVERILLGQRMAKEAQRTARHVKDQYDLVPPDLDRSYFLFETALKGSALETPPVALAASKAMRPEADKLHSLGYITPVADAPDQTQMTTSSSMRVEDAERRRKRARQFYRKLDKTLEWVENNYYELPIEQQNDDLIEVNAFWRDYADHREGQFLSAHLAEPSRNFTEMMLALAVLDLPFASGDSKSNLDQNRYTLRTAGPMVIYHRQIQPATAADEQPPILVSQNFFRHGDRYRHVNNERLDKFVTEEFLIHTVYGCQVVITNPTSSRQKLDVLVQIPRGAVPVLNSHYTRTVQVDLDPYHTHNIEYYFYFPQPGKYAHFPVHMAKRGDLIGSAELFVLNVVETLSKIDSASWEYVSQHGTSDEVLAYLKQHNLGRIKLDRIAWRLHDAVFCRQVLDLLRQRHVYDHTLWSYALKHNQMPALREYLKHADNFVTQCGSYIDSTILTIDPVERKIYQHMEYSPLVNARAHRLGATHQILNDRFHAQYHRLMNILSYRPDLDDDDRISVAYTMFLQDRVEEGLDFLNRVDPKRLETRLQYDYFAVYASLYGDDPQLARSIAKRYEDYPVDRWRKRFANVSSQLDEIDADGSTIVDDEDRTQLQTQLAATDPNFDFQVDGETIVVHYQHVDRVQVSFYLMDIELLFSRQPFVQKYSNEFSFIQPNHTQSIDLPEDEMAFAFRLPTRLKAHNMMIEVSADGLSQAKPYFSNALNVQVTENYGQLQVMSRNTGTAYPRVYIKVYAQMKEGAVRFYKDGYTDHRGRFDYSSLSTDELDRVARFSMLILSEKDGAVVREADPPKR